MKIIENAEYKYAYPYAYVMLVVTITWTENEYNRKQEVGKLTENYEEKMDIASL